VITYAVTTVDPVASTLLSTEIFEDEEQARLRWAEIADAHEVLRRDSNTRVNMVKIEGRSRTLLESANIYLPRGQ
jgi:hypothetical protein